MTLAAILDRIDDRINPIVVKELRQAVQSRMVVSILLLFLGLQVFLLGFFLMTRDARSAGGVDWTAGVETFRIQQVILLWTTMILVPAYAGLRLGGERADHNVDLMFISTLRPHSIVWGKFFANVVFGLLIFSACAPFMTFTYLLRGIDIPTILAVLAVDLLCMLFGVMLTLLLAALPGSRGVKAALFFFGFIQLVWLCAMMTGMTLVMPGTDFLNWNWEAWTAVAVSVAGVLASIGLMAFYAIAIISPPASNRILPLRLYLFVCWLALTVTLAALAWELNEAFLVGAYLMSVCPVLHLQFIISICERDEWGPRVRRMIPRRRLLRLLAWLFCTGAAGGVTFTLLLLLVTLAGAAALIDALSGLSPTVGPGASVTGAYHVLRGELFFTLYVVCYGLSAVVVRNVLLSRMLKPSMNWLVALLLVALGSSVPYVIVYVFFVDELRASTELAWWALPNPFTSFYEVGADAFYGQGGDYLVLLTAFLTVWVVAATLACLPWYLRQLRRFRPVSKRERELAAVTVVEVAPAVEAS